MRQKRAQAYIERACAKSIRGEEQQNSRKQRQLRRWSKSGTSRQSIHAGWITSMIWISSVRNRSSGIRLENPLVEYKMMGYVCLAER